MKSAKNRNYRFDHEAFIRAWQEADDPKEAGSSFGMTGYEASGRATYYRSRGIPLKKFSERILVNVPRLRAIALELDPTQNKSKKPKGTP